jgi:hypothetical protein
MPIRSVNTKQYLYVITFEDSLTHIKTFIATESPEAVYNNHKTVYESIIYMDSRSVHNNIQVYYIENPTESLMLNVLSELNKGIYESASGFFEFKSEIELLNELLVNCQKVNLTLKKIKNPSNHDDPDKLFLKLLTKYDPSHDQKSESESESEPELEKDSFKEVNYSHEEMCENDIDTLPLSYDNKYVVNPQFYIHKIPSGFDNVELPVQLPNIVPVDKLLYSTIKNMNIDIPKMDIGIPKMDILIEKIPYERQKKSSIGSEYEIASVSSSSDISSLCSDNYNMDFNMVNVSNNTTDTQPDDYLSKQLEKCMQTRDSDDANCVYAYGQDGYSLMDVADYNTRIKSVNEHISSTHNGTADSRTKMGSFALRHSESYFNHNTNNILEDYMETRNTDTQNINYTDNIVKIVDNEKEKIIKDFDANPSETYKQYINTRDNCIKNDNITEVKEACNAGAQLLRHTRKKQDIKLDTLEQDCPQTPELAHFSKLATFTQPNITDISKLLESFKPVDTPIDMPVEMPVEMPFKIPDSVIIDIQEEHKYDCGGYDKVIKNPNQYKVSDLFGQTCIDKEKYDYIEIYNTDKELAYDTYMNNRREQITHIPLAYENNNERDIDYTYDVKDNEYVLRTDRQRQIMSHYGSFAEFNNINSVCGDIEHNLAICNDFRTNECILISSRDAIKAIKNSGYFKEFEIMRELITPEDDEYYKCLAIKLKQTAKKQNKKYKEIVNDIDDILNSVHVFLEYDGSYDSYVLESIQNDYATPSEQVAILLRRFVSSFINRREPRRTNSGYGYKNEDGSKLLYDDFYQAFKTYIKANSEFKNKNVLDYVDDRFIISQITFYNDITVYTDIDGKKYLKDMVLSSGYNIPVAKYNQRISPRITKTVDSFKQQHNNSRNMQLRSEPINPHTEVSLWNQSTLMPDTNYRDTML